MSNNLKTFNLMQELIEEALLPVRIKRKVKIERVKVFIFTDLGSLFNLMQCNYSTILISHKPVKISTLL